ncbi:hypothetical protein AKJ16_DCAP01673 [Drosera capensis]
MQRVWSPELASKAYIDIIKTCGLDQEFGVAELISAMASGWNSKLIVSTWTKGDPLTTSIALEIASHHTGGRHVCVVPDEESKSVYTHAMTSGGGVATAEVIVAVEDMMAKIQRGMDFVVMDGKNTELQKTIGAARLCDKGAVLVRKNAGAEGGGACWRFLVEDGHRVVRTAFLPIRGGLDIAYVGRGCSGRRGWLRWREGGETVVTMALWL